MKLDIKKAIYSPFSEPKWYIKISILCFLSVIGCLLFKKESALEVLIELPLILISVGYLLYFCHNEIHDFSPLLPEWNKNSIIKYLKHGFIIFAIGLFFILFLSNMPFNLALYFNPMLKNSTIFKLTRGIYDCIFLVFNNLVFVNYSFNFKLINCFKWFKIFKLFLQKELFFFLLIMIITKLIVDSIILYISHTFAIIVLTFLLLISFNLLAQIVKKDIVKFEDL